MNPSGPILELQDFTITINQNPLFKPISLKLYPGKCTLILGPNGSGKSSLLRLITRTFSPGTIKNINGNISIADQISIKSIPLIRHRPKSQLITFSYEEELASTLGFQQIPRTERNEIIDKYISDNNLHHMRYRDPRSLSSGEQQNLVIRSASIQSPKLLLIDEPWSLLDIENQKSILDLLQELKHQGSGIIIADTSPLAYSDLVDDIVLLSEYDQQIVPFQSREEIQQTYANNLTHTTIPVNIISLPNLENISIQGIAGKYFTFGYEEALGGLTPKLPEAGIILITGKNGSGKTTLLRTLASIIRPLKGTVDRQDFILLEHDTFIFFSKKSVYDEWNKEEKMPPYLELRSSLSPFVLSDGERRRVALTICFSSERDLLLDEPTLGLDHENYSWFLQILQEYGRNHLIVISTNDPVLKRMLVQEQGYNR